jgi:hypothetical protein
VVFNRNFIPIDLDDVVIGVRLSVVAASKILTEHTNSYRAFRKDIQA